MGFTNYSSTKLGLILSFLIFKACSGGLQTSAEHVENVDGEPMILGYMSKPFLFASFPVFREKYDQSRLEHPSVDSIEIIPHLRIEVFIGTWCKDTKRELPIFLKILDSSALANCPYTLFGLDRSKTDPAGFSQSRRIFRVPTMIFYDGNTELGRITERPEESIETNILAILRKAAH